MHPLMNCTQLQNMFCQPEKEIYIFERYFPMSYRAENKPLQSIRIHDVNLCPIHANSELEHGILKCNFLQPISPVFLFDFLLLFDFYLI